MQVESFKAKIARIIERQASETESTIKAAVTDDASPAKLFEEIKVMFRDLPERLEGQLRVADSTAHRRRRRFDPLELMDFAEHISYGSDDSLKLMVLASYMRQEFPWVYELAADLNRAIKSRSFRDAEDYLNSVQRSLEVVFHGPLSRDLAKHDHHLFHLMMNCCGAIWHQQLAKKAGKGSAEKAGKGTLEDNPEKSE